MINQRSFLAKQQSGVVLVISLIMLLALTLIGVTSSSVTGLQEKMAANNKDINLAFQAAEAALRNAETVIATRPIEFAAMRKLTATDPAQGKLGYYSKLNDDETSTTGATIKSPEPDYYNTMDWSSTKVISYTGTKPAGTVKTPVYIIEEIKSEPLASSSTDDTLEGGAVQIASGRTTVWMRITAHGWGSNENSAVTLQSIARRTYTAL